MSCRTGEIVGLLGRNGCGKSSLLRLLFGTLRGDSRVIRIDNCYRESLYFDRKTIALLPQENFLPLNLKVERCIRLFLADAGARETVLGDEQVHKCLNTQISDLSGGERRYLELLLILSLNRAFFLLDEPFSELDPVYSEKMTDILRSHCRSSGIIITDHDYRNICEVSDRLLLLKDGVLYPVLGQEDMKRWGYLPDDG
jgi:ABC-type multidrug transport system ATPase subunit